MNDSLRVGSALLLPHGVVQPFPLRFRRDDLHVMAFFRGHPEYEAVEAMIQLHPEGRNSIRAIITRHDQTQIDLVNDDDLLAAHRGSDRECHRRPIHLMMESLAEGRRARLEFLSQADESIVLDVVSAGQPEDKRGGLTDPGGHSADSSLPLMWRGASALAGPRTRVTIDGVEYLVPEKIRAGPFVAHQGYYTERHSMGAIRSGTVTAGIVQRPDRLDVGAEWVLRHDEYESVYRVTALGADGTLSIAKLDDTGETVTAHAIDNRLAVTRISLPAVAGPADGLVLSFDRDVFSLSIEGQQDIVSGHVAVAETPGGLVISLRPSQPNWATVRIVRVVCLKDGDQMRFVTTIEPPGG
jgi:hypothetical protein